jgi:hypothetical protein
MPPGPRPPPGPPPPKPPDIAVPPALEVLVTQGVTGQVLLPPAHGPTCGGNGGLQLTYRTDPVLSLILAPSFRLDRLVPTTPAAAGSYRRPQTPVPVAFPRRSPATPIHPPRPRLVDHQLRFAQLPVHRVMDHDAPRKQSFIGCGVWWMIAEKLLPMPPTIPASDSRLEAPQPAGCIIRTGSGGECPVVQFAPQFRAPDCEFVGDLQVPPQVPLSTVIFTPHEDPLKILRASRHSTHGERNLPRDRSERKTKIAKKSYAAQN